MFQIMRVSIEQQLQRDLVRSYRSTSETLDSASKALDPLMAEASTLLGASPTSSGLDEVASDLRSDAVDLELRANFVIEADARVATLLSTDVGQVINAGLARIAISQGWSYWEAELRERLIALLSSPPAQRLNRAREIQRLEATLRIIEGPRSAIGLLGDLDADQRHVRIGPPLDLAGQDPIERGRELLIRALHDTTDPDRILADEFEAILHENGHLTLILPGVIDLSDLSIGLDPAHKSTRDLDSVAWPSSHTTSIADNLYAQRVRDWISWLVDNEAIAAGTPTAIIGHSFGAETAIDLASDPDVNGELLDISHVIPIGYHNEPLLGDVPPHTDVFVLQNIWDAVIGAEAFTDDTRRALIGSQPHHEGTKMLARSAVEGFEFLSEQVIDEAADRFEVAAERLPGIDIDTPPISIELKGDDYRAHSDNVLIVEFEGGFEGSGHHQNNYIEFLEQTNHPEMVALMTALADSGFTRRGTAVSVDVTQPANNSDDTNGDDSEE